MDVRTLFFSWNGRSARKPYWLGMVVIEVLAFVLSAVMVATLGPAGEAGATLVLAYPRICVVTKRFHDFGRSGWWQVLPNVITGMLVRGGEALAGPQGDGLTGLLLEVLGGLLGLAFLIWLGCVRTQPRTNDFGPPPGQADVVSVFE